MSQSNGIEEESTAVGAAEFTLSKCANGEGIEFSYDKYVIKTRTMELASKGISFEALACQRVVDQNVVKERVLQNLNSIQSTGKHLDFCEIKLCALRGQMNPKLYLVDGQHRICTMMILTNTHNIDIEFQAIIKLVDSMEEITSYFEHINKCRPIHPDTIMYDIVDKEVIESLTGWLEKRFVPDVIKPEKDKGFVDRPYLCHPTICNIYRSLKTKIDHQHTSEVKLELAVRLMDALNTIVKEMSTDISMNGLKNPTKTATICNEKLGGCFLGLLRKDQMVWRAFMEIDKINIDNILNNI